MRIQRATDRTTDVRWRSLDVGPRQTSCATPTRARSRSPCASASAAARSVIHPLDGLEGRLLRQCRRRELLCHAREGSAHAALLRHPREAQTAIFDYVESFSNLVSLHSTVGYLSPAEYETMNEEQEERKAA
jgi:transposase InsO family protein